MIHPYRPDAVMSSLPGPTQLSTPDISRRKGLTRGQHCTQRNKITRRRDDSVRTHCLFGMWLLVLGHRVNACPITYRSIQSVEVTFVMMCGLRRQGMLVASSSSSSRLMK